ncbi:MAG: phospho-N-acetylmuramoyl-pentapeptide-transferase [Deltaproteobacteria bacterium]|nr:phospho-N-acetylmuramoyl-pentapeptide-transferase [Deltaproteobacteria bacterium]
MFYTLYEYCRTHANCEALLPYLNIFKYITFRSFGALMTSLFIFLIFGQRFINYLVQKKIGQYIREEGPKSHQGKSGTPTMGGALIIIAGVFSTLLWGNFSQEYLWLCLGVLLAYGALGFVDDYRKLLKKQNEGLSPKQKILLQSLIACVAGAILIHFSHIDTQLHFPFFKNLHPELGWYYLIVVSLVIVGASNAVNLTDGLDGLAAGPSIVAYSTYAIFSYVAGNIIISNYLQVAHVPGAGELTVFCGALVGALLGFLWFNTYPAQVFMGDTGSLSLGASLGLIAVITKNEILLIMVGGIFVIEALSVISQVTSFKLTGKRIFRMAPIHHHFELKGWAEPKVIVRFWIMSLILAILSLATLKLR